MQAPGNIVELRQLLADRFPHTGISVGSTKSASRWATGLPSLDSLLGDGLPRGELTEIVGIGPGSGSALVIHSLLRRVGNDGQFLALVDGSDSFDVDAVDPAHLARLLWIRCQNVGDALKAADLILRDRNFSFLVLDLKLNPISELRKISSSVWFRFDRLVEQNQTTLLVVTPSPIVGCASCRVGVESHLGIDALTQPPSAILPQLRFTLLRSAYATAENVSAKTG